ncbi:MAG TPA: UvrD-helicase domain-containing protein [Chthoniobacterales bacterium]|nr:UvrD-helicase domain-containing protein [Chthoniobacterales bacterium]
MTQNLKQPSDQSQRDRFVEELERNFSVVASAGSGKTRAITDRVLEIARSGEAREVLPRLVVVTFTNRAADEMQQRSRQQILAENLDAEVVSAFNRGFFGTIHAFCMKLLTNYGHYLGLPAPLELITDDEDLWQEFVQQQPRLGQSLSEKNRAALFRLAQARDIMELARRAGSALLRPGEIGPCPKFNFSEVRRARDTGGRDTIKRTQEELADWETRFESDWEFLRWPNCFTSANAKFTGVWRESLRPLRRWVADAALCVAAEVQRDYRDFRLERGVVTYADQIALADELLQHPAAGRRVREQNFRVILDEAQDTDPAQFSVLLETARPPEANGYWLETKTAPPRPGHFCMVGDRQQSIFGDRADLAHYERVHDTLVETRSAEELTFSVTFRLDQSQVDFINRIFRDILNEEDGQVRFVELQPRPAFLPGQVIRVPLGEELLKSRADLKDYEKANIEAEQLARWIETTGLEKLRAGSWRDVAILCPRKAWLRTMARALRKRGLPVAMQSESAIKADSPAYAWLTALCTIMTDPLNGYEVAGVLREVFGIADADLAVFAEGDGTRFRIDKPRKLAGDVGSEVRHLAETRQRLEGKSLFEAITVLVRETQLRDRLSALPTEDFDDLAGELDALLALSAEAEAQGATLTDFAEKLRADFETPREARLSAIDGIQLITSQKAKGSEWQAVILPFLGRDIRFPSPRYPSLIRTPGSGEILVALSKEDPTDDLKKARTLAEQQEMQRLLYVATTRARHTLVLALDRGLFQKKEALSSRAQLTLLNDDKNAAVFAALEEIPAACPFTSAARLIESRKSDETASALPTSGPKEMRTARRRANDFVHKFNPSAYDPEIAGEGAEELSDRPVRAKSTPDTPATLYGQWWHTLFQRIEWRDGSEAADELFRQLLPVSPDQRRATAEWKLVRQQFADDSILKQFLSKPGATVHTEFPFAWSVDQKSCVEGLIDLLIADTQENRCFLLDWKTNQIESGEENLLRQRYLPQLAAYWKAVREITKWDVEAGIFATATGQFLAYDPDELATEWKRLSLLPGDELTAEILDDGIL